MNLVFNNVFGIAPDHTRQHAFCSRCNAIWGTCGHTGVRPIDQNNRPLVLESQIVQQHNGGYHSTGQQMYCGNCRGAWGSCSCIGYGPIGYQGNSLGFELEMFGAMTGDPTLVEEGAILNMTGGGGYGYGGGMGGIGAVLETEALVDLAEDRDRGDYDGGYNQGGGYDNDNQGYSGGGDWDDQNSGGGGDWDDQNNWQ